MEKIIELKKVNKHYGGVHALKDVDFSLNQGEIHCLIGQNGCGKSTMIKVISGVIGVDPISEVANLEKKVPLSWMNANHTQMTDEFLAYARPLIQAELTPLYIAGLPHHIYMKNQK